VPSDVLLWIILKMTSRSPLRLVKHVEEVVGHVRDGYMLPSKPRVTLAMRGGVWQVVDGLQR
jgi:hypothetical protein